MKISQKVNFAIPEDHYMKKFFLALLIGITLHDTLSAQTGVLPTLDKSALDISYYPSNYPILKIQDKAKEPLLARVIYSRPMKAGRNILGELLEYGMVWRLGANEATEIELFRDGRIGATSVKKGRYTLYAIPDKEKWIIIMNRETDTWGAFKYNKAKDVARIVLKPEKLTGITEAFTMYFEKSGSIVNLLILWDDFKLTVPFSF